MAIRLILDTSVVGGKRLGQGQMERMMDNLEAFANLLEGSGVVEIRVFELDGREEQYVFKTDKGELVFRCIGSGREGGFMVVENAMVELKQHEVMVIRT